jgi:hypothetical protein
MDAYTYIVDTLTDAGLTVTVDPRNVQPPCILVDPPSVVVMKGDIVTTETRVTVMTPAPGNREAMVRLLTDADAIIATNIEVVDGNPGSYTVGVAEYPAYSLTIRTTLLRSP